MKSKKLIFLLVIFIFVGAAVFFNIAASNKSMNNEISFSNVFQVVGNVTSSANRGIGSILPIDGMDEKELGDEIKKRYRQYNYPHLEKDRTYLNSLLRNAEWAKHKKFDYEIFVEETFEANAYALPGGAVVVTQPLLKTVKSESELMAIIAHEVGHIENSHCFNAVKFEILTKKLNLGSLGKVADVAQNILLRHSYSKTQEAEADDYAFEVIKNSPYDIMAVSNSFKSLLEYDGINRNAHLSILEDYFQSHPSLEQRIEKFAAKANAWKKRHPENDRYIGRENLAEKISFLEKDFGLKERTSFIQETIQLPGQPRQ
ncbi:MAG: M48 family metallopeptidase [Lactobacillaceae bacterium]|jgi:predicted Zn-dependent protease|nr:M48 family metallopeptidase [Lactobacillaceae bacterium]